MRFAVLAAAAILLLSSAAVLAAAGTFHRPGIPKTRTFEMTRRPAQPTEGTWTLTDRDDGTLQLSLRAGTSDWGQPVPRADFAGLTDAQVRATEPTPVAFRIEREPGVLELEGTFRDGRGAGRFRFRPDASFASVLREVGVGDADAVEDHDLMVMALGGTSGGALRELAGLGVRPATTRDVVQMAVFDVTPAYAREVRVLWGAGTQSVAGLVQLRVHRVSAAYVRALAEAGLAGLSMDEVMQMSVHGVEAAQVRAYRETGLANLTAGQVVALAIHGVTPEYVREMRAAGFGELSPDALTQMRIHHVTPDYVRALADAGYPGLDRGQLMQMTIHRVTPEFIREVRAAGHGDVSPEALVRMRILGIGAGPGRAAPRARG